MATILMAAFLGVFAVLMISVAITVRLDRLRDYDAGLEAIDADIERQRIAYHCRAHGHAFCHPELHNEQRVWRCENCGDAVVSRPGWVGDAS